MELTVEQVARALADSGWADTPTSLTRLTAGASQETYRVEFEAGPRALRRAPMAAEAVDDERPDSEAIGLLAEGATMRCVAAAGVAVPEVLAVIDGDSDVGDALLVDWLDGETLGGRIARSDSFADVRPQLARQCGDTLARIHRVDRSTLPPLEHRTPRDLVIATRDRYLAFDTPQPMIDFTARWLLDHLPADVEPTLVHGDFRNGNLMVDPADGVIGVLDWELAHLGDPMRDLGWLCTGSWRFRSPLPVGGFGTYDDLFAGYESITGLPVDRDAVHFWEVFGSFWWSVGCLAMVDVHRRDIDTSPERLAIGRRSSECQADCVDLLIPGGYTAPTSVGYGDAPSIDELLGSVAELLRSDRLASSLSARDAYLARVAANSAGIAGRDARLGPWARDAERGRLETLLGTAGSLESLRRMLCDRLRDNGFEIDDAVTGHLRQTVKDQLAIDQPRYPTRPPGD